MFAVTMNECYNRTDDMNAFVNNYVNPVYDQQGAETFTNCYYADPRVTAGNTFLYLSDQFNMWNLESCQNVKT